MFIVFSSLTSTKKKAPLDKVEERPFCIVSGVYRESENGYLKKFKSKYQVQAQKL